MPVFYKILGRKNPQVPSEKEKYYGQVVSRGKIDINDIAKEIRRRSSLGFPDIIRVLMHVTDVVSWKLDEGYTVDLLDLAIFNPSIQTEGVVDPKKFRDKHIKRVRVIIRPKKRLNEAIAEVELRKIKSKK